MNEDVIDGPETVHYTVLMDAVNYTELRNKLKDHMDKVCDDHEPLIITRKGGRNVVMMSLEDYNSYKETEYLLSSPANAKHLMESIEQLRSGNLLHKDLIEE